MVDWKRLRLALADRRSEAGLSALALAKLMRAAGHPTSKTTIYRIENVRERPKHRPDLDTIAYWLMQTSDPETPIMLSEFFAELERRPKSDLKTDVAKEDNAPSQAEAPDGRAVFTQVDAAVLASAVENLSTIQNNLERVATRLEQTSKARARAARRRNRRAQRPRKTA